MKQVIIFFALLTAMIFAQAQDTVHFTQFQQDTDIYYHDVNCQDQLVTTSTYPYSIIMGPNAVGAGYVSCLATVMGAGTVPSSFLLRQSNKEPLTVYGIAVGFVHPPDSAFGTWLAIREHGNWGDTLRIVDSSGPTYNATRYYHVEAFIHADSIDAVTPDCNSQVTGSMDTAVLCYEYYFTQPITVDSAFYIGVYPRITNGECQDSFYLYGVDLCSEAELQGNWIWTSATIPDPNSWEGGRHHARTHWIYRDLGSAGRLLVMPIIRPSTECDVPFCGSVDSLWMETDGAGQVSLEWTALSCVTTRYEVNYGSDKPLMDTTVITSSTSLQLTGLLPGSLVYARVRPICLFNDTDNYGSWSDSLFFTVPSDTTPCPDVHGLASSWMDTNCAYVTWTPVDEQSTYQLNYAEADSLFENGTFVSCPHPYAPVCGLSTDKAYKMRVRTPCSTGMASEGYGPWGDTLLFNHQPTGIEATDAVAFSLRPNPARDRLTVERPTAGPATLEVFNAKGQKVMTQTSDQSVVTLDVSSLMAGSYLLRVTTTEGSSVRSFVVGRK